jgi:hypothetical protein
VPETPHLAGLMSPGIQVGEKSLPSNFIQPPINAKPLTRFERLKGAVIGMNADVNNGRHPAGGLAPEPADELRIRVNL